jgi:hypothetical protein
MTPASFVGIDAHELSMHLHNAGRIAAAAPTVAVRALPLALGAEVVARVLAAPPGGGRGVISLAGMALEARLPDGLAEGQTLRLAVDRAQAGELLLRILREPAAGGDGDAGARLASALALAGDGELLRAALGLTGGEPVPLPGRAAAEVAVNPDDGAGADDRARPATAGFVLHSPELGPIEVQLTLDVGGVRAAVTTAAGEGARRAEATLPDLAARLERAVGRPPAVTASTRAPGTPAPPPPASLGGFTTYA